jgi:protein TonB
MHPSIRKPLVFGAIVIAHVAAVLGLTQIRAKAQEAPVQALAIRWIEESQQQATSKPVEVATISPRITIDPPEMPVIELPSAEETQRAITLPMRASAPVVANVEQRTPKLISTVEYIREPAPRYPPQSRKLREQGLVMLKVLIDEKGVACSVEIESSSGYARLDHAAREAVTRAAFRPYVEDGEPRRALVLIPIEFYLNRSSA